MMKKLIAGVLCVMLLSGCVSAMAEETGKTHLGTLEVADAFTLQCRLPDDYQVDVMYNNPDYHVAVIYSEDEDKPQMYLSIAFDELLAGVELLNDLDDEALAQVEETFREEDEVEITHLYTSHGTKLLMVKEVENGISYVDFYTIYLGYQIEIVMNYGTGFEDRVITEKQIEMAVDFLSDLDFIPAS